jgi:hypothetical protein
VYERLASSPSAPARARARQGAARPLTPQALQKVLEWLAREELEEGAAAVEARDYVRAVTVLDRVNPIDDRGAKAGYLQAKAMYGSVVTELARPRPTGLAAAEENLRRAERLARRAATSPSFAYQAGRLLSEIEKVTQRVSGERRLRPIVEPFKALKSRYLGRTITYFEAAAFRRSLASLRVKVEAELRTCPGESVEARKLQGIRREILHLQGQLPYV